ncbi:unnamed protein product, partial [Brenthis ino]
MSTLTSNERVWRKLTSHLEAAAVAAVNKSLIMIDRSQAALSPAARAHCRLPLQIRKLLFDNGVTGRVDLMHPNRVSDCCRPRPRDLGTAGDAAPDDANT